MLVKFIKLLDIYLLVKSPPKRESNLESDCMIYDCMIYATWRYMTGCGTNISQLNTK